MRVFRADAAKARLHVRENASHAEAAWAGAGSGRALPVGIADFEPGRSDLDVLVSFDELPPVDAYDADFSLKEGLEGLFHRPVDLVMERAVHNPHFRARLDSERQPVFHVA